jgi:hypothetical protein
MKMRNSMKKAITLAAAVAMAIVVGLGLTAACARDSTADLDVQTFRLQYLEPPAASRVIDPYVFVDRGGQISIDERTRTITVRETPEMLSRIGEILAEYDKPAPSVRLHFRLIEANGVAGGGEELQDIRDALPEGVFRFRNYRQIGEAVMTSVEWSEISQRMSGAGSQYFIRGETGEVRVAEDGGTAQIEIILFSEEDGEIFQTEVNARIGQLLVLGSAQPRAERGALILAVQAELAK